MSPGLPEPAALIDLEGALRHEREALVVNDVEGLLVASQAKLDALRRLEADPPSEQFAARLSALADLNRENGHLLSRRRRVVDWTLRQLGRQPQPALYDPHGSVKPQASSRVLGAA